jgi:altered-inheritance-of-mitochondria protein 5
VKKDKEDNEVEEVSRRRRPTKQELLKHQWNKEAELLVRRALAVRWEDVRGTAAEGYKAITRLVKRE